MKSRSPKRLSLLADGLEGLQTRDQTAPKTQPVLRSSDHALGFKPFFAEVFCLSPQGLRIGPVECCGLPTMLNLL